MFNLSKKEINDIAKINKFISNTVEKVLRLIDVLDYIGKSEYGNMLSLKGGTAINLCILDLPRLSVDIDFDFSKETTREEMLEIREAYFSSLKTICSVNNTPSANIQRECTHWTHLSGNTTHCPIPKTRSK